MWNDPTLLTIGPQCNTTPKLSFLLIIESSTTSSYRRKTQKIESKSTRWINKPLTRAGRRLRNFSRNAPQAQSNGNRKAQTKRLYVSPDWNCGRSCQVHKRAYRAGHKSRLVEEDWISSQLRDGIIRTLKSVWSSPVVSTTNTDESMRFCIDYRRLNDETKKYS